MRQNRPKHTKPPLAGEKGQSAHIGPNAYYRPIERLAANMPIEDYTANIRPNGTIRHNWHLVHRVVESVEFDVNQPIWFEIAGFMDESDIWIPLEDSGDSVLLRSLQTDGAGWFQKDIIDQNVENGTFLPITWDCPN